MDQARKALKLTCYEVKLHGHPPIKVMSTSKGRAYGAVIVTLRMVSALIYAAQVGSGLPSNVMPMAEFIRPKNPELAWT